MSQNGEELGNLANASNGKSTTLSISDPAMIQRARDHGWQPGQKYDYELYSAKTREEQETLTAARKENVAATTGEEVKLKLACNDNQKSVGEEYSFTKEHDAWSSAAMRYEWKDEYGEVGPAHPELELQLFQDVETNRAGGRIDLSASLLLLHGLPSDIFQSADHSCVRRL